MNKQDYEQRTVIVPGFLLKLLKAQVKRKSAKKVEPLTPKQIAPVRWQASMN